MAKVTWLGQGDHGPETFTQWNTSFKKGEAVEVADPSIWTRAQGDPFFKVEVEEPKAELKAKKAEEHTAAPKKAEENAKPFSTTAKK